ncbi:DUF2934 domain-containing protein [Kordiimonas gwangyangensis]|uniref:DUF2934 domain-containing protein n=1 Tax=Kordiimonas gwangyangensis TaxID=288022 RepID=UPI000374BFA8|nr:DUF2934 domain-containing protein [Kordiimonas gwangyangensis]
MTQLSHEQIAQRSFMIWEQEGRPSGQALDHWLQAERELTELFSPRKKATAAPKKRIKAAGTEKTKKATKTTKPKASKRVAKKA